MAQPRTLVVLPPDLVKEVDALVGSRKRSAFFAELARKELKRRRLLLLLDEKTPIWRDEDHPEMKGKPEEWVRGVRREWEHRLTKETKRRNR